MSGNHEGERVETGEHNGRLRVGQAVVLQFHALAGLTGVVEGLRDGHRCLVRLDTVQRGVLLDIDARAVTARPPPPIGGELDLSAAPRREHEDPDCIGV